MTERRIRGTTRRVENAARELRRNPTEAEARLWTALRRRQMGGALFRRQHPVGRFVLDFYCASHRLCVEVDGEVHEAQRERDAERTAVLNTAGIRVLRFSNDQVLRGLSGVVREIAGAMDGRPGT